MIFWTKDQNRIFTIEVIENQSSVQLHAPIWFKIYMIQ